MNALMMSFIFLCIYVVNVNAEEGVLYYDGRPLEVNVAVGRVTELVFPKKVARIVKGGLTDSILVEVMENSVLLLPKNDNPPDVFVTNTSGSSYPLHLVISADYQAKLRVKEAFTDDLTGKNNKSVLDLMKIMMQGRVPIQATVISSNEVRTIANGSIELKLNTTFELPRMKGLMLTATNLTDNTLILPIQSLASQGLLAIASEQDTLEAKGKIGSKTKVLMVIR